MHFVIIVSISKVLQVPNKPKDFSPPIQMKWLITMKLIHAEYNPMHNSIDINHYIGYSLRIDCNQAESGIQTTPNFHRCLNVLTIDTSLEYAQLALDGEMQAWVRRITWKCFNTYALANLPELCQISIILLHQFQLNAQKFCQLYNSLISFPTFAE